MAYNIMTSLVEWQKTLNGQKLMAYEKAHLNRFIDKNHIDRLLQISGRPLTKINDVYHYVLLEEHIDVQIAPVPTVQANINLKLPFRNESFQTIVICHAHERVSSLPALLEEVERLLVPEGNLIIYGINFTSLWAVALLFKLYYVPFCNRLYSDFEIKKHIGSLDLKCEYNKQDILKESLTLSRIFDMAFQAHYVLIAKKTVSGMMLDLTV